VSVDYEGNILITENDLGFIRKIAKRQTTSINTKEDLCKRIDIQVYPNPFNSTITITYSLISSSFVEIEIYIILGQRIKTLLKAHRAIGKYEIKWDGTTNLGVMSNSGIYFCKIKTGKQQRIQRMLLMK
jgi:flagellar hook assembly protein FlgD